jgi:hypothetical protein
VADRPELDGAGLQHALRPPEDVEGPYPLSRVAGSFALLVDSTGIKVEGEGEWNARKHGGP